MYRLGTHLRRLAARLPPARRAAPVTMAIGAAAMCSLAAVFAEILDNVLDGDGIAFVDGPVATWLATHRDPGFTGVMRILTQLGSPLVLVVVMGLVSAVAAWRSRSAVPLGIGGLALGGFGLTVLIVKLVVVRPRPPLHYRAVAVEGYSFPSGHAIGVSVIGIISAWLLTRRCADCWLTRVTLWIAVLIVIAGVGFPASTSASTISATSSPDGRWERCGWGSSSSPCGFGRHFHWT
ncbi:hypothetical protein OHQ90_34650 [Nocardia sp. NBC_00403]